MQTDDQQNIDHLLECIDQRQAAPEAAPKSQEPKEALEIQTEHGPFIIRDEKRQPIEINQVATAVMYSRAKVLLFEPVEDEFYLYNESTGLYKQTTRAELGFDISRYVLQWLRQSGDGGKLLKKRNSQLAGAILTFLQGAVCKRDAFDASRNFIHCANGVLRFRDGEWKLDPFSSLDMSRNRTEINYDPRAKCPRFLNELVLSAVPAEDAELMQRYVGQILIGRNLTQKMLLLRGMAGGGKSTFVSVVEMLVGRQNVSTLRTSHLKDRFELWAFIGKTLLCGKDVDSGFMNCAGAKVVKSLCGGDFQQAEAKSGNKRADIRGVFNIIVTSNSALHVSLDGDDGAWQRRLMIVDYERPPATKIVSEFDRLLISEEGSGIMNWGIEGARKLLEDVAAGRGFTMTQRQRNKVLDLIYESDSVRRFAICRTIGKSGADVTTEELSVAYQSFCDEKGWQALSVKQFEQAISTVMMETYRATNCHDIKRYGKDRRGFKNVSILEQSQKEPSVPSEEF